MNKDKMLLSAIILVLLSSTPVTMMYSQTHWPLLTRKNDREELNTFEYRDEENQESVIETTQAMNAQGRLKGSVVYHDEITKDNLTGNLLGKNDGENNKDRSLFSYDAQNRLTAKLIMESDLAGNIHTTGQKITYQSSPLGKQMTIAYFDYDSSSVAFYQKQIYRNSSNQETYEKDTRHGDNIVLQLTYDDLGHLYKKTDEQGNSEILSYNTLGKIVQTKKVIHWNTPASPLLLDQVATQNITIKHNINYVTNQITSTKSASFMNRQGRVLSLETTAKNKQYFSGDNQLVCETDSAATTNDLTVLANYNNFHDKISESQANGKKSLVVNYQQDTLGNTVSTTIDSDIKVRFHYDLDNHLATKWVNGQQRYYYTRGAQGELLQEDRYMSLTDLTAKLSQTYDYQMPKNANGQQLGNGYYTYRTDWLGHWAETDRYEKVDGKKIIAEKDTPDAKITYYYDYALSKLRKIEQQSKTADTPNATITYHYNDAKGELIEKNTSNGQRITYSYVSASDKNNANKLQSKTIDGVTTYYQYNGNQLVKTLTKLNGKILASTWQRYGPLNETLQIRRFSGNKSLIDVINKTYDNNDPLHRVTRIDYQDGVGNSNGAVIYQYTNEENNYTQHITSMTECTHATERTITTNYSYDHANHLLSSIKLDTNNGISKTTRTQNSFDALGNMTDKESYTTSSTLESQRQNHYHYDYNKRDQLLQITKNHGAPIQIIYDKGMLGNGNMTQDDRGNTYRYNSENQQKQYSDKQQTTNYQWLDARRWSKRQGNTVFYYLYEGNKLINTRVSQINATTLGQQNNWQSIYLPSGIRIVVNDKQQPILTQFLETDNSHSVAASVEVDEQGRITRHDYYYNDDGSIASTSASTHEVLDIRDQPMLFNGDYYDMETGQQGNYYKLARLVHTFKGGMTRFTTMDFNRQLMNLYQQDASNTLSYRDSGGHMPRPEMFILSDIEEEDIGVLVAEGIEELVEGGELDMLGTVLDNLTLSSSEEDAAEDGDIARLMSWLELGGSEEFTPEIRSLSNTPVEERINRVRFEDDVTNIPSDGEREPRKRPRDSDEDELLAKSRKFIEGSGEASQVDVAQADEREISKGGSEYLSSSVTTTEEITTSDEDTEEITASDEENNTKAEEQRRVRRKLISDWRGLLSSVTD